MIHIPRLRIVNERDRAPRRWLVSGILIGVVIGFLSTLAISFYASPVEIVDPRMEKGCRWPTQEGEMTVVTVMDNKIACWVWK